MKWNSWFVKEYTMETATQKDTRGALLRCGLLFDYWTVRVMSSSTKLVCADESSVPVNLRVTV